MAWLSPAVGDPAKRMAGMPQGIGGAGQVIRVRVTARVVGVPSTAGLIMAGPMRLTAQRIDGVKVQRC